MNAATAVKLLRKKLARTHTRIHTHNPKKQRSKNVPQRVFDSIIFSFHSLSISFSPIIFHLALFLLLILIWYLSRSLCVCVCTWIYVQELYKRACSQIMKLSEVPAAAVAIAKATTEAAIAVAKWLCLVRWAPENLRNQRAKEYFLVCVLPMMTKKWRKNRLRKVKKTKIGTNSKKSKNKWARASGRERVWVFLFFRSTKIFDVDISYRKTKPNQTHTHTHTASAPISFSFGFVFVLLFLCNRYSPLQLFFYASVNVCVVVFVCYSFAYTQYTVQCACVWFAFGSFLSLFNPCHFIHNDFM